MLSCPPVSSRLRGPMSIGFRMKTLEEIQAELGKLSDAQLIERGKTLRQFAKPRPGQG
jgi:hypothetical protein